MKKVLLFFMLMIGGALVYILSFATDATKSSQMVSSAIIPIIAIYAFFGFVLIIIGRKGHGMTYSR